MIPSTAETNRGWELRKPSPRMEIDRGDFPVPPELAGRDPGDAPGEHLGGLRVALKHSDGEVRLGRCYYQNPLRVFAPMAEHPGGPALLLMMSATPGLLDGDGQLVEVDAGPGVRAFVTSQSAGKIHPCPRWHASAVFQLRVAPGATLCFLPGPTIPFAGSRFYQSAEIDIEEGGAIVWGDILLAGRTHHRRGPERFAFDRIVQELRVRREGKLVHYERFSWAGPWGPDEIGWHFGKAEAAASLFISGAIRPEEFPGAPEGVQVAFLETAFGDTCVRLLGEDPEQLIAATARIALGAAARLSGGAEPWFIGSNRLAAGHWFTPPLS